MSVIDGEPIRVIYIASPSQILPTKSLLIRYEMTKIDIFCEQCRKSYLNVSVNFSRCIAPPRKDGDLEIFSFDAEFIEPPCEHLSVLQTWMTTDPLCDFYDKTEVGYFIGSFVLIAAPSPAQPD